MTNVPTIGQLVRLREDGGLEYTSRVEDAMGDTIAVARPSDLRAAVEYTEGMAFDLVWTHPTGIHALPVALTATGVENNVRLWYLSITGRGWTEQRRDYVRVPVRGHVTLSLAELAGDDQGDETQKLQGSLLDVSEVAMQCEVPVPPDDPRIAVGRRLQAAFQLGSDPFELPGSIVIVRSAPDPRQARVVVRFDQSETSARELRKQVFALQLASRRER